MIYYVHLVGFYGPIILGLVNAMFLWCRKMYLISYVICSALNLLVNSALKIIIKEPRPSVQIYMNDHDIVPDSAPSKYGMPSGHAQSVGFSTTFLYLVVHSPATLCVSLFICALTIYQRHKYRRHTIYQLVAGLTIGSLFALASYEATVVLIRQPEIKVLL
jgi:membrane-associated phospholipid phosphatase